MECHHEDSSVQSGCDGRKMGVAVKLEDHKQLDGKDSNADTKSGGVDVKEETSAVNIESWMVADSYDDDNCEICRTCGGTPCYWKCCGVDVIAAVHKDHALQGHAERTRGTGIFVPYLCGKRAYRLFPRERFGNMGSGNRFKLLQCVLDGIRHGWPGNDGRYIGFMAQ